MERQRAALGIFLTLNKPSCEMEREAAAAGLYEIGDMKVPRLQILTAARRSQFHGRIALGGPRHARSGVVGSFA